MYTYVATSTARVDRRYCYYIHFFLHDIYYFILFSFGMLQVGLG
jgi:hypothetical protein